jgi:CRP-like cAMP-binding protein
MKDPIEKAITNYGILDNIPRDEIIKLHKLLKRVQLKKDDYFLRAGEIPNRIGFNVSGLLRLFYIDHNGKDITKHFCVENSLAISYSALIKREPSKFSIQALEDSKLLTFTYDDYISLLNSNVCWQIAAKKLAELIFILKENREAELLLLDANGRYQNFINDFPTLLNRIPQYYIASYLRITPESLSRIRANFKN